MTGEKGHMNDEKRRKAVGGGLLAGSLCTIVGQS